MILRRTMFLFALIGTSSCTDFDTVSKARPLEAGDYQVCSTYMEYKADFGGPHIVLGIGDHVVIESIDMETNVIFRRTQPESLKAIGDEPSDLRVPMRFSVGREWLSTQRPFGHQPAGGTGTSPAVHLVRIENEPKPPKTCIDPRRPRVIAIRFCYVTTDDAGKQTFACPGSRNPHNGDTHANA